MSGGDQDGIRRTQEGIQNLTPEVLEAEYTNAKDRLAQQQETLQEFSQEGIRMFRLRLLLVAAPAAILGALSPDALLQVGQSLLSNDCAVMASVGCIPVHILSIVTGGLFVIGAGLEITAAGYESRGIQNLTNPKDIKDASQSNVSLAQYHRNRLQDYLERIKDNDRVISAEEELLAFGKISLYFTTFGVATIAYVLLSSTPISSVIWGMALLIYFLPVYISTRALPKSYWRTDGLLNRRIPVYSASQDSEGSGPEDGSTRLSSSEIEECDDDTRPIQGDQNGKLSNE